MKPFLRVVDLLYKVVYTNATHDGIIYLMVSGKPKIAGEYKGSIIYESK